MSAGDRRARRRLRIEDDGAGARVSASWATYLGLARKEIDRAPARTTDARRESTRRSGIAAQLAAESHRQFAERHGHGGGAECASSFSWIATQGFAGGLGGAGAGVAPAAAVAHATAAPPARRP